jgi:predicted phage tail protein
LIQTQQRFSNTHANLTEGFIHFTIDEPYVYELTGNYSGAGADAGDNYQQRTFLRMFQSPFTTIFLEDEPGFGAAVALAVNQQNDTGAGGIYNQSGPRFGVLVPGTYEFNYELENRDNDLDAAATSTASGLVQLILRKVIPPSNLTAQASGLLLSLAWAASSDATSYQLEAETGSGLSNVFTGDIGNITSIASPVPAGVYFIRVRAKRGAAISETSNEAAVGVGNGGCIAPPAAPTGHTATTAALNVSLTWNPSPGATSYRLEAGTGSGLTNLFDGNVGTSNALNTTAPAGTYFTRVRAVNGCGTSNASNEVQWSLACVAPPAPTDMTFTKSGGVVNITWTAAAGAATYRLQAGTTSGSSNLFNSDIGAGTGIQFNIGSVPAGTYFLRVLATNSCGTSVVSNEIAVQIP